MEFLKEFTHFIIKKDSKIQSTGEIKIKFNKGDDVKESEFQYPLVVKTPKKNRGLMELLFSKATRYLSIDCGYIYSMRKINKDHLIVSSRRELTSLFKIYVNNFLESELRLCFCNKEKKLEMRPIIKILNFNNAVAA